MKAEEEITLIRQATWAARLQEDIQPYIKKAIDSQASETTQDVLRDIELLYDQLTSAKETNQALRELLKKK